VCSGCFAQFIGPSDALVAELHAAMNAIEVVVDKGYTNMWMKYDSQLVIQAFKSSSVVSWHLKARWKNCLYQI